MAFPRFIHEDALVAGTEITLSTEEAHHLTHVLRLEPGEKVEVVDGRGTLAVAEVVTAGKKGASVQLLAVSTHPPLSRITIAFGVPKPPALEFILRRATEIGVESFQPLLTRHSLRMSEWNDRRWSKIVLEVCKQCQELNFPRLHAPVAMDKWLAARPAGRALIFFDETDRAAQAKLVTDASGYDLLVGPEGGWAPEEITSVRAQAAHSYGLGRNRLRAEMAALIGAALVKKDLGEI